MHENGLDGALKLTRLLRLLLWLAHRCPYGPGSGALSMQSCRSELAFTTKLGWD